MSSNVARTGTIADAVRLSNVSERLAGSSSAPEGNQGDTRLMDRAQLAAFLRTRREALQPEDVGLPRGPRRRTGGLRREEVAVLSGMSTDYYSRIEQRRGPNPSEQMLAAIARGLHLSLDERDHLFRLAGHATRGGSSAMTTSTRA